MRVTAPREAVSKYFLAREHFRAQAFPSERLSSPGPPFSGAFFIEPVLATTAIRQLAAARGWIDPRRAPLLEADPAARSRLWFDKD